MAIKWTKHPVLDDLIPTKEEMAKMSPEVILELWQKREEAIEREQTDPYRYGYEISELWSLVDEQLKTHGECLIAGGNRASKSSYCAKRVVQSLVENPGFAVAPNKNTEYVINQNKLDNEALRDYLETHATMFEKEGAHLGGWLNEKTGQYMLDVAFPLSYEDAVRHAMWGDQDAIFDLSTFKEIKTRDEKTKQVKPPEGFPESINEILRKKPRDTAASAEESFRKSSPIREQSIEAIRGRAESSREEVRQSTPPPTRGENVGENFFTPAIDYDREYQKKYPENDPRRSGGYLTTVNRDGNEVSPLSIREGQETLRKGKQIGSLDLVRFTHFPNRKVRHPILEVSKHGSGIPGAEARRKANFRSAYVDRIYFGDPSYRVERGLETDFPHVVDVDKENLWMGKPQYEINSFLDDMEAYMDELGVGADPSGRKGATSTPDRYTAFENFIKKQGFLGIYSQAENVGYLFHDVKPGEPDAPQIISYDPAIVPGGESDTDFFSPSEQADQEFQISTRNPTATNRRQDPVAENLVITLDDILNEPGFTESYAKAVMRYPGIKVSKAKHEKVLSNFVDMVVDNLLHLYDSVDPEIRERSKLWYVGARKIALDYANKYNISQQAVAAAMAATSPQTDWYKNVDRTRRILETVVNEQETVFNNDMVNHHIKIASAKDKAAQTALAKSYSGKKFKELNKIGQAAFIRAFDELYRSRDYQVISPEGEFLGAAKKDNGENEMYSWLSYNQITKALSAIEDDSKANISNVMGEAHKIRNFYNNILLPFVDTNAVTIDTHAVAAALLRPLASKDVEVGNMLGAKATGKRAASIKNSKIAGISGLYGVYADAYRKAAKARGVLPREMQSITWEAIRGLYPKEIKQPKFKEQINNLFKLYENGKITINELRTKVFEKAGGIDPPTWFGPGDTSGKDRPGSGFYPQGRRPPVDERQLFSPSVRGLGARDRSRGVRATTPGITTSGLDRFMIPAAARAAAIDADLEKFRN
jgi:hypothetical protein